MSLSNIFTSNLPSLDLHGENSATARVLIQDFIRDNRKLKNDKIVIIHGKGTGILRKTTHDVLKKHRDVIEFQIDFYNEGSTIVRIRV